jgi:four helix bundle protein
MALYDLEDRTLKFAIDVKKFTRNIPRTIENIEFIKQLIRAAASIGANYIEANESLGEKDKKMKIRISKKESKESRFFCCLVETDNSKSQEDERKYLVNEATELMNILGAILKKLN